MTKVSSLSLSDRDKTPKPSGWGHYFHHTNPQRRVPCVLGDILAPLSADDIPPITPAAMAAVQAAITLLANLVGDRDHGRFLGCGEDQLDVYREKAREILGVARSLTGILRVTEAPVGSLPGSSPEVVAPGSLLVPSADTMAQPPRSWPPNTGCDPKTVP